MGPQNPSRTGVLHNPAELRAQHTRQAANPSISGPTGTTPPSAEHELREYMQEMRLKTYGHAGSLLSSLYRTGKIV